MYVWIDDLILTPKVKLSFRKSILCVYIRLKNSINWWMVQNPLWKSCIPHDWFEHWTRMEGLWNIPWNKLLPYQSTVTISSGGSVQKIIYRHLLGNHAATCNLKWLISPQNVLVRIVLYNTPLSCSKFCSNLLESLGIVHLHFEVNAILKDILNSYNTLKFYFFNIFYNNHTKKDIYVYPN